jgi:hypothetical protein
VPAVGILQWPSVIWHTQYDTIDKLDAGELARCAWATAAVSYQVAAAGPREALVWMHDVAGASRRRLVALGRRARRDLLAAGFGEVEALLDTSLDALRYRAGRDSQAIASCLVLARDGRNGIQASPDDQCRRLVEGLARQAQAEASGLQELAGALGMPGPGRLLERAPDRAGSLDRRPVRVRPGLINMKYQAIAFGPQYAARDPHFMDRLAEMMNLSDGSRTISEIARILGHEIGPIAPSLIEELFNKLEALGFVELRPARE